MKYILIILALITLSSCYEERGLNLLAPNEEIFLKIPMKKIEHLINCKKIDGTNIDTMLFSSGVCRLSKYDSKKYKSIVLRFDGINDGNEKILTRVTYEYVDPYYGDLVDELEEIYGKFDISYSEGDGTVYKSSAPDNRSLHYTKDSKGEKLLFVLGKW